MAIETNGGKKIQLNGWLTFVIWFVSTLVAVTMAYGSLQSRISVLEASAVSRAKVSDDQRKEDMEWRKSVDQRLDRLLEQMGKR